MANVNYFSFDDPVAVSQIKRQQAIAEMLRNQAAQPLETNQTAGGYVVPVSPLQGISKIAQALMARSAQKDADKAHETYQTTQREALGRDTQAIVQALQGSPEQPFQADTFDENDNPFGAMTQSAVSPDRNKAIAMALQSQHPGLQNVGGSMLAKALETREIDYNKPFLPDGRPNSAYQEYELKKGEGGETFSQTPQTLMHEGKPIVAIVGNKGTIKPLPDYAPYRDRQPVKIGPGETLLDPQTNQPVYTAPPAPPKPAPGYRPKPNGDWEAIPGGPADIKAGELGEKREKHRQAMIGQAQAVRSTVKEAKALVGYDTAGAGGLLANLPLTDARDLRAKLDTIKANLGFDRLQMMRDMSPTGGALGQVAVQELNALQQTVASLDQLQKPGQLRDALEKIDKHYANWLETLGVSPGATGSFGNNAAPKLDPNLALQEARRRGLIK